MNRLPYSSNASSCGLRRPVANTSRFDAVEIAAQHGAADSGLTKCLSPCVDVEAAVADAEVQPAVGADDQAVHVVAAEGDAHAVAVRERLANVGLAVAVVVRQQPQVGECTCR